MEEKIVNQINSPKGLWNSLNPFTKANKNFRIQQELEINKNRTHVQRMQIRIKKFIKLISHAIGYITITLFTASPWLYPVVDVSLGLGHIDSQSHKIILTWWDHVGLTILPSFAHAGLWLVSKPSKSVRFIIGAIPAVIASPYIFYKYVGKRRDNEGIMWHKRNCIDCKIHSNKVRLETKKDENKTTN